MAFVSLALPRTARGQSIRQRGMIIGSAFCRVLTHIQKHLDEHVGFGAVARLACFSSFHFHRVFAAMTGETIADHVRRWPRLERAAMELRSGAKQVIQVALDADMRHGVHAGIQGGLPEFRQRSFAVRPEPIRHSRRAVRRPFSTRSSLDPHSIPITSPQNL